MEILMEILMENIPLILVLCALAIFCFYIYLRASKVEDKKKVKSMSDKSIKILESKKEENKKKLEMQGFKIYRELISPVEPVNGYDNVKIIALDFINFNMAVTPLTTASKMVLPKIYDIKNIIEVKIFVNDKLDNETNNYEEGIESIKLSIKAKDAMNPQYQIALLPKIVAMPDRKFETDYLDYARALKKELDKVVSRNTI